MTSSAGAPFGFPEEPSPDSYRALIDCLKRLRGADFEDHGHPAVLLDRATPASTLVWGWWATESPAPSAPATPCLLWADQHGWSATVIEPGELDGAGYERAFWSHRVNLLDLALANAIGPFPTLEQLEAAVAAESSFGAGAWALQLAAAVLWGVRQLKAARAGQPTPADGSATAAALRPVSCRVDEELVRHSLVPTLAKHQPPAAPGTTGIDALLAAIRRAGIRAVPPSREPSD